MSGTPSFHDQFGALLRDFCSGLGLPMDEGDLGIEFSVEPHTVLIISDPRDPERLLVEVNVRLLEGRPPALLAALHQLNDAARLEHDWVITLDVTNLLRIHTQRSIAYCKASDLQTLLAEGIERAQALQALCEGLPTDADSSTNALSERLALSRLIGG
jgi:hypothetical protein